MLRHKVVAVSMAVLLISASVMVAAARGQESSPSASVVPRLVSFSGAVKDTAGKPVSQRASLTFSLYELEEGGIPLWVETQTVQTDDQGRYTVLLGADSPDGLPLDLFTTGQAHWLGIQPALPGVGELSRVLLVGVPYALKAADAETLGGKPASAYVLSSLAATQTGSAPAASAEDGGSARAATEAAKSKSKPGPDTATGLQNYVAKFTDSNNDLGDSEIYDTGTKVGIGTTTPAATLDVNGNFNLPATTSASVGVVDLGGSAFIHACCPKSTSNTFVGLGAGSFIADASGSDKGDGGNTGVGYQAIAGLTTGYDNTAIGEQALRSNTSGSYNTTIGGAALYWNTSGSDNTATGLEALYSNSTGSFNTANGFWALEANTTGYNNTAMGYYALRSNTVGYFNTTIGEAALASNITGSDNTATGLEALYSNSTGSDNTAVGYQADVASGNLSNATAIGAHAVVAANNALVLGGTGGYAVNVGIGTTTPSATLDVVGGVKLEGTGNGITFPDGSTQTTAAKGGSGTITGVAAGAGLNGGGNSGNVTLSLNTAFTSSLYAQLAANNTFVGNQTVNGNVSVAGSGNGITFPDGSKQTTAVTASLAASTKTELYTGANAVELSCDSGYIVVCASCDTGSSVVINDQNSPLPAGLSWAGWLIPSSSNATGVHCVGPGTATKTLLLRCAKP